MGVIIQVGTKHCEIVIPAEAGTQFFHKNIIIYQDFEE